MKIIFDEAIGKFNDLVFSLYMLENMNLMHKIINEYGIELDKDIARFMENMGKWKGLDREKLRFFFHDYNKGTQFVSIGGATLGYEEHRIDNFNEVLMDIEKKKEEELIKNLIKVILHSIIGNSNLVNEKYKEICSSKRDIIEYIKNLSYTPEEKWNLFLFIDEPKKYALELCNFLRLYKPIFENYYKNLDKIREKFNKYLKEKIEEEGIEYLNNLSKAIPYKQFENICIYPLYIGFCSINYNMIDDKNIFVGIGFKYEDYVLRRLKDTDEYDKYNLILKAISDKSKFSIIKLLMEREMYGMEIAERLNLTTATISHHMSQLFLAEIVLMDKQEGKVYYKLNKETLKNTIKYLNNQFKLD